MQYDFAISSGARQVVATLQDAGYETYIVGGAIRDLLLDQKPKDFDISTSATPEEVRSVFGRRRARIIGKRFRLAHVTIGDELFEVSTFRRTPSAHAGDKSDEKFQKMPEKMIVSDNSYGTPVEDAFRRDFTANALFYDPVKKELIDHTGMGIKDIENHVVRAIGDPALRFEEDPVRMLRALKLVAQFDFALDSNTENALFGALPLLRHASAGRLSLELEKILKSTFSDRHFEVFFDYGLLEYFLPFLSGNWGSNAVKTALNMIYERNCRVSGGWYRDSISLALATAAYPFAAEKICGSTQGFWERNSEETDSILYQFVEKVFSPQILMVRVREAAIRIMRMQCILENAADSEIPQLMRQKSYSHARELLLIRHLSANEDVSSWERRLPPGKDSGEFRPEKIPSHKKKRNHRGFNDREKSFRKRNRRPVRPADFEE